MADKSYFLNPHSIFQDNAQFNALIILEESQRPTTFHFYVMPRNRLIRKRVHQWSVSQSYFPATAYLIPQKTPIYLKLIFNHKNHKLIFL